MARKRAFEIWTVLYVAIFAAYALFLLYPMYSILRNSVVGESGKLSLEWFVKFFSVKYYSQTLVHSFTITIWTTILTLIIGVPLSYFYNMYEIKGKGLIQVLIILCSMSAPFIGAYAWIQLLGRAGTNFNFAAAISVIAIVITAVFFLFQRFLSNRFSFTMNALHPIERRPAKGLFKVFIHLYAYLVVGLAFLPQIYIVYQSFQNTSGKLFKPGYSLSSYQTAIKRLSSAIPNTFIIGGIALVAVVLIAIIIAYLVVRRRNVLTSTIDTMSMLPYVIPGSVVGIALVMAFNKSPLILTGTGAIISWVTIITELSTAIILYNSKTITLTLAIYTFDTRGNYGYAAALATVLTALTIVSLLIFMKFSKSKEITF
jgi:ABC-type Fe3+ transport system permease subunit